MQPRQKTNKPPRLVTANLQGALTHLYADLGWNEARQKGFNRRICGCDHPRTTTEAAQIYQAVQAILRRLLKPYYPQFVSLVNQLLTIRSEMTPWERTFLADVAKKLATPHRVSPAMVKKAREVAHKHSVSTGFPSFKQLAAAYDAATDAVERASTDHALPPLKEEEQSCHRTRSSTSTPAKPASKSARPPADASNFRSTAMKSRMKG